MTDNKLAFIFIPFGTKAPLRNRKTTMELAWGKEKIVHCILKSMCTAKMIFLKIPMLILKALSLA